ncbi:glyoxalase [Enterococcus sp. 10A9_DIV0425]|nr:glyoxalase [Enterococcus sp. 10A9_DIV0425]
MFYSEEIFDLYKLMQKQKVVLGDLVQLGEEYVFNFADPDGNYFAVTGK